MEKLVLTFAKAKDTRNYQVFEPATPQDKAACCSNLYIANDKLPPGTASIQVTVEFVSASNVQLISKSLSV